MFKQSQEHRHAADQKVDLVAQEPSTCTGRALPAPAITSSLTSATTPNLHHQAMPIRSASCGPWNEVPALIGSAPSATPPSTGTGVITSLMA
jgi:hypothetical protein